MTNKDKAVYFFSVNIGNKIILTEKKKQQKIVASIIEFVVQLVLI